MQTDQGSVCKALGMKKNIYIYIHKNINICIGLKPWKRTVLHSFFLVLPFGSSREACLVMSCNLILWNTHTTNDNTSEWWLSVPNCSPSRNTSSVPISPRTLCRSLAPRPHFKMAAAFLASQQPMLRLCIGCLCLSRRLCLPVSSVWVP